MSDDSECRNKMYKLWSKLTIENVVRIREIEEYERKHQMKCTTSK